MKIFIGSDHAGFELKEKIDLFLVAKGFEVVDEGTQSAETSVDYPDFANLVCRHFVDDHSHPPKLIKMGILICGSGQGVAMRANKFPHVRAALCWNTETARLAREHNDANILCLGSRLIDEKTCFEIIETFISTSFAGGRHEARVVKVGAPI
jgi:ribose 5-phosphate isomerase B